MCVSFLAAMMEDFPPVPIIRTAGSFSFQTCPQIIATKELCLDCSSLSKDDIEAPTYQIESVVT